MCILFDAYSKTPSAKLTEQLERIWNEYPSGLLDLTEDLLLTQPPEGIAFEEQNVITLEEQNGEEREGPEGAVRDGSKALTREKMEELRSEIFVQLKLVREPIRSGY